MPQRRLSKPAEKAVDDVVSEEAEAQDQSDHDRRLAEIDAMIDEIDEVLEPNAAEFVKQYVQKGGE